MSEPAVVATTATAAVAAVPAPVAMPAMPKQNGITRPKPGTKTGRVWEIADALSAQANAPAPRKNVIAQGVAEGINPATLATQYGRWRRFHGLAREPVAKAPVADVKVETPAKPA